MAAFINTNIASLNAQRNLNTSQSSLTTALQRLSSGLRINSAKDDSAGLAIADRMTSQIRGANQAARNANDGVSLAQTAEGDLNQIGANLQRIRELAVQASNASNSASDRSSLNNEATQLISEIDRVSQNSSFNGVKLLDGSFNAQTFQVGANNTANDRIAISSIASARASALGGTGSTSSATLAGGAVTTTALAAGDLNINGFSVGASVTDGVSFANGDASAIAKAAAINAISGSTGVTASVAATTTTGAAPAASAGTVGGFQTAIASNDVLINGVNIGAITASASAVGRGAAMSAAINSVSSQSGVTATFSVTTGAVSLTAVDGRNISVAYNGNAAFTVNTNSTGLGAAAGATGGGTPGTYTTTTSLASITLSSSSANGITVANGGAAGATAANLAVGTVAAATVAGGGLATLNLSTAAGANAALATIDAALSSVNSSRASLGAFQNRFTSAVASLQTTSENLSASRSRIEDTDFAAETANLTRGQILQQAGTAMLAQANSLPNGVLSLLR